MSGTSIIAKIFVPLNRLKLKKGQLNLINTKVNPYHANIFLFFIGRFLVLCF